MFNRELILNEAQKQVILSGILGDGNIKRNGKNYYYREGHSKKETEYCKFKHDILQPYISKGGFHLVNKRDGQFGFQTINSPTLREYKAMDIYSVINALNEFGLLLYILDDGWINYKSYNLCMGLFNDDIINEIISKYNSTFNINCYKINNKQKAISFVNCMEPLLVEFKKYIPHNIDVYRNKVQPMLNIWKV